MEIDMAYAALAFFAFVVVLVFFLGRAGKNSGSEPEQAQEPELTERFLMGRYVQGMPGQQDPVAVVSCAVTGHDFVVCKGTVGDEIGRIARHSVNGIDLLKETNTLYRLELSWDDSAAPRKAIFLFDDKRAAESMATAALESLRKWQCPVQDQAAAANA